MLAEQHSSFKLYEIHVAEPLPQDWQETFCHIEVSETQFGSRILAQCRDQSELQ
ncbi:hypothetical protein [Marinomonas epiphytica]